jgi:hypothetical protein
MTMRPEERVLPLRWWSWNGLIGVPLAWFVDVCLSYVLVPVACHTGWRWPLLLVTAVALGYTAWSAWLAWKGVLLTGEGGPDELASRNERFLLITAFGTCVLFAVAIIALLIPKLMHDLCG